MRPGRKQQDIDDFINDELGEIQESKPVAATAKPAMKPIGGVGSKPAFAMAGKKPGALGSKPMFAVKKKQQAVDDLIESELGAIDKSNAFASPDKPSVRPPSVSYSQQKEPSAAGDQMEESGGGLQGPMTTPAPARKDMGGSAIKKGPTMFMKPKLPTKKKFQMAAPDAEETAKFDKLTVQQVKAQELNRDVSSSALKKKLDDKVVAPMALVQKTQAAVQYNKYNPRPPSEALNKRKEEEGSGSDYSEGGGFDAEEDGDDKKYQRLRAQIAKENAKVSAKVESGQVGQGPTKLVVKSQGPKAMNVQKGAISRSNITRPRVEGHP